MKNKTVLIVDGLESGADDYINKPFSPRGLVARIKTLIRRTESREIDSAMVAGALVMDSVGRQVRIGHQAISLGPTEYKLLEFFLNHQNRAFTREQLLNNVWGANVYIDERTIDVHIRRLRKAISLQGYSACIQTVRGFGYRFSQEALVKSAT